MEAKLKLFNQTFKMLIVHLKMIFTFPNWELNRNRINESIEIMGKLHELLYDFEKELAFLRADGGKVYELYVKGNKTNP
jgi:hypothetical protein